MLVTLPPPARGTRTPALGQLGSCVHDAGRGAQVTIKFNDQRKGTLVLDVTDEEGEAMGAKGRKQARRGRRPKAAQDS